MRRKVIVEQRTYTFQTGKVPEYLRMYEAEGYQIQRSILGEPFGYFSTEVGADINQVIHLWAYKDFADRSERRAALQASADWKTWLPKARQFQVRQENRILVPAPFMKHSVTG